MNVVKSALDKAGSAFYCSWKDDSMTEEEILLHLIDNIGAKIVPAQSSEVVDTLRKRYSREMPW